MRYQNISDMAGMFQLSRDTIRKRLRAAGVMPVKKDARRIGLYDMAIAGPALFKNS